MNSTRDQAWVAIVFALLIVVRLPALTGPPNLSQDATEYIDIARNVAAGDGLMLGIRGYFLGDGTEIPYPAQTLRSPLFPLLMGSVYAIFPSPLVFQWFNLGLFAANFILLTLILRPLLRPAILAYGLLLVGLSEPMFLTSIFPWAEQTAFFFLLLTVLMASRELHVRWGAAGAALEGMAASLAGLSRPEYLLVGILFLLWLATVRNDRKALIPAFLAGLMLAPGAMAVYNLFEYGRMFLPGEYLLRSPSYASYFTWEGDAGRDPRSFIGGNWPWILQRIARNFVNYMAKLIGWKNLFLFTLVLPAVVLGAIRREWEWRRRHLVFTAAAFFLVYCMVWAGIDRERYLLPVTTFLLPICLWEADRWRLKTQNPWSRRAAVAVMSVSLPLLLANVLSAGLAVQSRAGGERFYAVENPAWANPDFDELAAWVRANVAEEEVVCLENPFLLNYLTGRPTVVLPERIDPERFGDFLSSFRVAYWVNNTVYTKRAPETLRGLEAAAGSGGAEPAGECGTYRIWRIPPNTGT